MEFESTKVSASLFMQSFNNLANQDAEDAVQQFNGKSFMGAKYAFSGAEGIL